jgi:hypothetical protein
MEDVKDLNCGDCKERNCAKDDHRVPCCLYCKHIMEHIICSKCRGITNSLDCKFKEVE